MGFESHSSGPRSGWLAASGTWISDSMPDSEPERRGQGCGAALGIAAAATHSGWQARRCWQPGPGKVERRPGRLQVSGSALPVSRFRASAGPGPA